MYTHVNPSSYIKVGLEWVQLDRKHYLRTQVGATKASNDNETVPLNYSNTFTPAVLAGNGKCQTPQCSSPNDKKQDSKGMLFWILTP